MKTNVVGGALALEISEPQALQLLNLQEGTYMVLDALGNVFHKQNLNHISDYVGGT